MRKLIVVEIETEDDLHCDIGCDMIHHDPEDGLVCPFGNVSYCSQFYSGKTQKRHDECLKAEARMKAIQDEKSNSESKS